MDFRCIFKSLSLNIYAPVYINMPNATYIYCQSSMNFFCIFKSLCLLLYFHSDTLIRNIRRTYMYTEAYDFRHRFLKLHKKSTDVFLYIYLALSNICTGAYIFRHRFLKIQKKFIYGCLYIFSIKYMYTDAFIFRHRLLKIQKKSINGCLYICT
jgi:hypothetical protein